jgi:hypothetical protein
MNIYGYKKEKLSNQGLLAMKEVTFAAEPALIREIAEFLIKAADQMDKRGEKFGHMHVDEVIKKWKKSWPQIIVAPVDVD